MRLRSLHIDDLTIEDERSFRHVALYELLKSTLSRDGFVFRAPERGVHASWDRVLFLNLTFWSAHEPSDVLAGEEIPADVVAHAAWHHLARKALGNNPSADALFFGEAIASAFDLYLVGRLLGHAPDSLFLESQVGRMADAASEAGVDEAKFEALIQSVASDPDRAFEDLRELLFDAGTTLVRSASVDEAAKALENFDRHRFGCFLHHYELSNWILYAKAFASRPFADDPAVRALDAELRAAPVALDLLEQRWLR
jgi:hypothetical protein